MANCKQCGKEYKAKRSTSSYCGPKCKQEFYRNRMSSVVTLSPESVTVRNAKPVIVTSLDQCQYCNTPLPALQEPRKYPGACYQCAIEQPDKQREANRAIQARRRSKGVTDVEIMQGMTEPSNVIPQGVTSEGVTFKLPEGVVPVGSPVANPKRGKDIKCFADLPPDVQRTIDSLSESNDEHAKRTQIAIKYQHLFPDSNLTGVAVDVL